MKKTQNNIIPFSRGSCLNKGYNNSKYAQINNPYNLLGFEKFTNQNGQIEVNEEDGSIHRLTVGYMVVGANVIWIAKEEASGESIEGYEFKIASKVYEDQFHAYKRLEEKVQFSILKKTLTVENGGCSNNVIRNGKQYSIGDKGIMCITHISDGEYGFVIDGMLFTPKELALMLSMYEGFNLVFSITDPCD